MLRPFVECLWLAEGTASSALETIVPDACPELIFHLGERFLAPGRGGPFEKQPRALLVALQTGPLRLLSPAGHVRTLGVRFRPAGLRAFLSIPLHQLIDRAFAFRDLWSGAGAGDLENRLAESLDDETCFAAAEAFLVERLEPPARDVVSLAVAELLQSRGSASTGALAAAAGISTRQLERRFRDAVGLPPKPLARIVRLQEVMRRREREPAASWVELALDCGYFDQAHLSRDFRELTGEPPARFLEREADLAARFTDAARLDAFFAS